MDRNDNMQVIEPQSTEETPLISNRRENPLDKAQLAIIMVIQICEPLQSQTIYPFLPQLVSELDITGGDQRRIGFYAGLIESLFFATQAVCILQWSRASDFTGRKPVLLIGLAGGALSTFLFGLSSHMFWALVVSRSLCGALNGNVAVMKSAMGDITTPSNRAMAVAGLPIVWAFGDSLLGGALINPAKRFPAAFSQPFWIEFPYFLPCLVTASFTTLCFLLTAFGFKETVPRTKIPWLNNRPDYERECSQDNGHAEEVQPVKLRELMIFPVLISCGNYVTLAFLDIVNLAIMPLFLYTDIQNGGLGLKTSTVGYIMAIYGVSLGAFQFLFFAPIMKRFSAKRVFMTSISMPLFMFSGYPLMNLAAKRWGRSPLVWTMLCLMIGMMTIMDLAFACIFMFVTSSAPNKRSLGATNGLSQTAASIIRAVGPAAATSLFSLSVTRNLAGGNAVYLVILAFAAFALYLSTKLPSEMWEEDSG